MLITYKNQIPDWILDDDTFLFHGSSNISEHNLDKGVTNCHTVISQESIDEILSVYEKMNWCGDNSSGYAVLCSFSKCDVNNNSGRYFFLANSPYRSILYSSHGFAGGELLRSVYFSIRDLYLYLTEDEFKARHLEELKSEEMLTGMKQQIIAIKDIEQLTQYLNPLFLQVQKIRNNYKYGIVYCYKMEESDYNCLEDRKGMGIRVNQPIPTSRLKAKIIVDENYIEKVQTNYPIDPLRKSRVERWSSRIS